MVLLFLIAALTSRGCVGKTDPHEKTALPDAVSLTGYIVIDGNTLYFDEVEIITSEDTGRISDLELSSGDMPNGYCVRRLGKETVTFKITDETVYTFVDINLFFIEDADGDRLYTTSDLGEFMRHLNESYNDTPPAQKVPFFIQVRDGVVIGITEEFEFTI